MTDPDFTILYVDDPTRSATFYSAILGAQPVESSPGYAMFVLPSGTKLGLWLRREVQPAVTAQPGGSELVFTATDDAEVDRVHGEWSGRGITIAQPPAKMEFGYTFVGVDPDGHRLRVYARGAE